MKDINDRKRSWQDVEDDEQAAYLRQWQREHSNGGTGAWVTLLLAGLAALGLIAWGAKGTGWLP